MHRVQFRSDILLLLFNLHVEEEMPIGNDEDDVDTNAADDKGLESRSMDEFYFIFI